MKTIIIEDDILNIDLLQSLIQRYFPKINITAICNDVDTAIEAVFREQPELIFLDINLKEKTAFDILRVIDTNHVNIIIITAYEQHAIKMFDFNITYYLLKPIEIPKFIAAVKKVEDNLVKQSKPEYTTSKEFIGLPTEKDMAVVPLNQIVRIDGSGNYSIVHLANHSKTTITKTIGEFEKQLPKNLFIRIHNSHIINLNFIKSYNKASRNGSILMVDDFEVPISASRKELLENKILL